jgi:hypothetical protein
MKTVMQAKNTDNAPNRKGNEMASFLLSSLMESQQFILQSFPGRYTHSYPMKHRNGISTARHPAVGTKDHLRATSAVLCPITLI